MQTNNEKWNKPIVIIWNWFVDESWMNVSFTNYPSFSVVSYLFFSVFWVNSVALAPDHSKETTKTSHYIRIYISHFLSHKQKLLPKDRNITMTLNTSLFIILSETIPVQIKQIKMAKLLTLELFFVKLDDLIDDFNMFGKSPPEWSPDCSPSVIEMERCPTFVLFCRWKNEEY